MSTTSNISRRRSAALSEKSADYSAKRDELVRIAARLFRELGFKGTRLADVAKAAGLDRATLYYYIGSKEELLREIVETVLDNNVAVAQQLVATPGMSWTERLTALLEQLMLSYAENYPYPYVYIQEQMGQVSADDSPWAKEVLRKTQQFERLVMRIVREAVAAGELRGDIPVRLVTNAVFGMFNWTHRWFSPDASMPADVIARSFMTILLDGMKPVPPRPTSASRTGGKHSA
jgi:AcrR family transcriptional regulator